METVLEALGGARGRGVGRPTYQPVHRYTRTLQGQERGFWQPFDKRHAGRFMLAAEKFDRLQRLKHRQERNGRKNGTLGHVGLEVLRELLRMIDHRSGRLDPAIATIAARIGRSIAAVVDALKRLKAHGFLDWLRRYVPTGEEGARGPQVKQTSNAYRLSLPAGLAHEMRAPLPEDDCHRRQNAIEEADAMLARLPLDEQPQHQVSDPELAELLARLARGVMRAERDSAQENESTPSRN